MKENPDSFCHLTKHPNLRIVLFAKKIEHKYRGACGNRLRAGCETARTRIPDLDHANVGSAVTG